VYSGTARLVLGRSVDRLNRGRIMPRGLLRLIRIADAASHPPAARSLLGGVSL
jgi:hypothetical protein